MDSQLILDRYRPLHQLGEGGFGSVVLAWDTRMQRRVAIKRIPLPLDASGNPHRPPGLAEARTAAMLNHPAIITVLDFDTDSDEAFIVMEYVDGASLGQILDDVDGALTLDEAAAVVDAVTDALEYAHDNGVLHLDIKPENVLITRDGRVKVADFGISALSSLSGHASAYGGTPGYMPLEQLEGRQVSARTDQWAFAVLVYESLTGQNPFAERTPEAAVVRLGVFDPPAPSQLAPDLAGAIDEVLLAALGDRPQDRCPSVSHFADALLPHLGDPAAGRTSLAGLVDEFADDEADDEAAFDSVGLWDRLGGHLGFALLRGVAAVEAGWLAWAGLSPLSLERPALLAAAGLIAAGGALAPSLGVGLGLGCLIAGVAATGAFLPAAALGIVGAAWWWWLARRSAGSAVLPLAAPALGALRAGFAQPLLAGFALTPLPAAATGLLGGVLALLASAATLAPPPYTAVSPRIALAPWDTGLAASALGDLVLSPATYVALAGWPLAAVIMSLACTRATRAGAFVGVIGGSAALGGSYLLAEKAAAQLGDVPVMGAWSGSALGLALGVSLILVLGVVAFGAPIRAEEEGRPSRREPDDED